MVKGLAECDLGIALILTFITLIMLLVAYPMVETSTQNVNLNFTGIGSEITKTMLKSTSIILAAAFTIIILGIIAGKTIKKKGS